MTKLVVAVALVFTMIASAGFSQPGGGKGLRHRVGKGDIPTTRIMEMLSEKLQLTDEQRPKVQQILEETKAGIGEQVGAGKELLMKAREKLVDVLNDEQKAKLKKMKEGMVAGVAGFAADHGDQIRKGVKDASEELRLRFALGSMDLTDEQKAKLRDVSKELREKTTAIREEMQPKLDEARKQAKEKIDAILTPEQKEQLEKKIKEMPKGDEKGGPGRDGDRGQGHRGHAKNGPEKPEAAAAEKASSGI